MGFSDSGTKMIDLMGTIFEESVQEDVVKAPNLTPTIEGHFTLKLSNSVVSPEEHNRNLIQTVVKKKLKREKIDFSDADYHKLES